MSLTNHPVPEQSKEMDNAVSLPIVEWMPLDGLAQAWAAFAAHSTQEDAFAAARLAFTALEQETSARRLEAQAQDDTCPTTVLYSALNQLADSAISWLLACERLEDYRTVALPDDEEQEEQAVLQLRAESYQHLLAVAYLSVRLVQQLHAALAPSVRALLTDCPSGRHGYHATWMPGYVVCTGCGQRAVCPVCVPQQPDPTLALYLCAKHQPKEVEL